MTMIPAQAPYAILLMVAMRHRIIEPTVEAGFERFASLTGGAITYDAFCDAVAACLRERLILEPVRLPEGALQCHWHLELTPKGAQAARHVLACKGGPVDSAELSAAISAAVAIGVAAITAGLTYLLTKRREREADWRKMKLDCYKEYVAALSGIVEGRDTPEGQIRYVDAVNSLTLVASPQVPRALYAYLDYTTSLNTDKGREHHDELLTDLVKALRRDVYPSDRYARDPLQFRLITVPPHMRISREATQQT